MYEVDKNTVSLLHFEDGLNDSCGLTWNSGGVLQLDDNVKKFGTKSMVFDGKQYLKLASSKDVVAFGTGDYTIDCWVYATQYTNDDNLIYMDSNYHLQVGLSKGKAFLRYNGTLSDVGYSNATVPLNTWVHLAVVRYNGITKLYINGKVGITYNGSYNVERPADFIIGTHTAVLSQSTFRGYMDEIRISNIARWTSDFTLPGTINVPTNLIAAAGESQVALSWQAVAGAVGYNVKRSATAGGSYTVIATKVTDTGYVDAAVTNDITYYYVVTAIDSAGNESANSNEASAVTPPTGNALLRVTMIDSSEREYRLPLADVNGFVNWINHHANTDALSYTLNKTDSKEHLLFDKIISFEVIPLTK